MNIKLPAYQQNSKGGAITVTSGKFSGKSFPSKKNFDLFFADQAAKGQAESMRISKMYNDSFKRNRLKMQ
tara:strand:- start:87 stop:296 length:210 start_codon:yes stop_codon:yes gene_type:complete